MDWLNAYSEEENLTKRAVIERALRLYQIFVKKTRLKKMFKELNEDPETLFLAEAGLDDYLNQIKNYENEAT